MTSFACSGEILVKPSSRQRCGCTTNLEPDEEGCKKQLGWRRNHHDLIGRSMQNDPAPGPQRAEIKHPSSIPFEFEEKPCRNRAYLSSRK